MRFNLLVEEERFANWIPTFIIPEINQLVQIKKSIVLGEIDERLVTTIYKLISADPGITILATEDPIYQTERHEDLIKTPKEIDEYVPEVVKGETIYKKRTKQVVETHVEVRHEPVISKSNGYTKPFSGMLISAPFEYWNLVFNHEFPHIIGIETHCHDTNCLMHGIPYNDFENAPQQFCASCTDEITTMVYEIII